MSVKKVAAISHQCVACGCCVKACPAKAITVYKGLKAVVTANACLGCGRCAGACPADVINVQEREVAEYAEAVV